MIITKAFLRQHMTEYGGWTKAQTDALGVPWPPRRGWQDELLGKEITEVEAKNFADGKNTRGRSKGARRHLNMKMSQARAYEAGAAEMRLLLAEKLRQLVDRATIMSTPIPKMPAVKA